MNGMCETVDCVNEGLTIPIPSFLAPDVVVEQLVTPPAYCGWCDALMTELAEEEES